MLKKTTNFKNYLIIIVLSILLSIYLFEYYLTYKKNENRIENYKVKFLKKNFNKETDIKMKKNIIKITTI